MCSVHIPLQANCFMIAKIIRHLISSIWTRWLMNLVFNAMLVHYCCCCCCSFSISNYQNYEKYLHFSLGSRVKFAICKRLLVLHYNFTLDDCCNKWKHFMPNILYWNNENYNLFLFSRNIANIKELISLEIENA